MVAALTGSVRSRRVMTVSRSLGGEQHERVRARFLQFVVEVPQL